MKVIFNNLRSKKTTMSSPQANEHLPYCPLPIACCLKKSKAFTLIEMVIAISIVGLGISGLMFSMAAGTRVNEYGSDLSDAVFLADQMGTIIDQTAFDDLPDLNGKTYSGVDSQEKQIAGMDAYTQAITVQQLSFPNLTPTNESPAAVYRVTVTVTNAGQIMASNQWLKTAP